ncbi:unnamed protein product [Microthlaspi erraticum]|uniref:Agenet domain-containing protein n=1 Tax=Microthlaspi erraticum TaxID=1685480 RepID=A0A6D2JN03_9BRAS|nr:unnamed protein product [Microthlaspi erraticum]
MKTNEEAEVCTTHKSYKGAWFKAVLLEDIMPSCSRPKKKFRDRYQDYVRDDNTPLIESLNRKSIRPVPPEEVFKDVVLEKGTVVDANCDLVWWTGVVVKLEDNNFFVLFDSPPHIVLFEKKYLRAHVDREGDNK